MPITYSIDREMKLITEVWIGEISTECLAAYWTEYLQNPDVMAIRRTLVDLRRAEIRFRGADLDALIHGIVEPALKGRIWQTAIIVEKDIQYGLSRQYHVFAGLYSRDAIFFDLEKAREWLLSLPG